MIIDFLTDNWLPIILFVLGIPLSIYVNQRFFPRTKLGYRVKTERLFVKPKISDIEVYFKKKLIDNLYSTKILIINTGKSTITKTDKPTNFPIIIKLTFESDKILEHNIIAENRKSNSFAIKKDGGELAMDFDYMNPRDGCIISMLHTFESNLSENFHPDFNEHPDGVSVEGELIGIEKIEKLSTLVRSLDGGFSLFIISFFIVVINLWISYLLDLDVSEGGPVRDRLFFVVGFLISMVMSFFLTGLVNYVYIKIIGKRTLSILEKF